MANVSKDDNSVGQIRLRSGLTLFVEEASEVFQQTTKQKTVVVIGIECIPVLIRGRKP